MKKRNINKKKITAFLLSFLLVMQQSFALQVLAESIITDANGVGIDPNGGTNTWNIRPDAGNGNVGFKQFDQINLGQGDVLNFIYQYITQGLEGTPNDLTLSDHITNIDTFVALVNNGVNIQGIVNALQANGALKTDGNLMFITPGGMVVGATGVLNVGNLSVVTPTNETYEGLTKYLNLPQKTSYYINNYEVNYNASDPSTGTIIANGYDYTTNTAVATNKTFDVNTLTAGDGTVLAIAPAAVAEESNVGKILINGKVAARGDVNLNGGKVGVNGILLAGVRDNTVLTTNDGANTLFNSLVKASDDNTTSTEFSNFNGNIVIKSVTKTEVGEGGKVRNLALNGDTTITNTGAGGVNINGQLYNANGNLTVDNSGLRSKLLVNTNGDVQNNGTMTFTNSGSNGMDIAGNVTNNVGAATFTNKSGGQLLVENTGRINSNGSSLLVENYLEGDMDIQGKVTNTNSDASVKFFNQYSDMKIGHADINENITSNADVVIEVATGNLLNNGVSKTLIKTTDGAHLNIAVENGRIGDEVGPCADGVCTGIGEDARDLTKSINTNIDGNITAKSTLGSKNTSLINMASLDNDMHVDQIKADGRVILLADNSNSPVQTEDGQKYNIVNRTSNANNPNVEGTGISLIASGNIGEDGKALTFRQNGVENVFYGDDARNNHVPTPNNTLTQGVDMLAIGNINVKGMDTAEGKKLDTNVCAMISRTGNVNAEFSGDTYIKETTAADNINITTRGKNLYIDNLGMAPNTYNNDANDYYGPGKDITPNKVKLTALDLGSYWDENENPGYEHAADSTIVVQNGRINGKGIGRDNPDGSVNHEQDLVLVADNAYAGGYYFNMGKHRGENGKSTVIKDDTTNPIKTPEDKDISIRGKAVRPEDVAEVGGDPENQTTEGGNGRNYYYGGSSQGGDPHYDGVDNQDGNGTNDPNKQGTEDDDDNLVVPEKDGSDTDNDNDTDIDTDTDLDTDTDIDSDSDIDTDTDTDVDNDDDIDTDTDVDTDTDTDTDIDNEPDITDTDNDNDTDNDIDTDNDTDTDIDSDSDIDTDTDIDNDDDIDTDTDNDTDTDDDPLPTVPQVTPDPKLPDDIGKELYKQRVVENPIYGIDKRQYMRFNTEENQNTISFESTNDVIAVTDISRGGVSLKHNKKLKVGDVVPVHLKYGDLEIQADVKVVSASDVKAGAKFINLDKATANKLLYLSLLTKDEAIAQTIQNISTSSIDEE